jgi:hypothetical protein
VGYPATKQQNTEAIMSRPFPEKKAFNSNRRPLLFGVSKKYSSITLIKNTIKKIQLAAQFFANQK